MYFILDIVIIGKFERYDNCEIGVLSVLAKLNYNLLELVISCILFFTGI